MKIEVEEILLNSGWSPSRSVLDKVELPHDWIIFGTAEKILDEFGNLRLCAEGAGLDFAKEPLNNPIDCSNFSVSAPTEPKIDATTCFFDSFFA